SKIDARMTQAFNSRQIVAYEKNRPPAAGHFRHFPQAFLLKFEVADRKYLVINQDLGVKMRRHSKSETNIHSRAVPFYRCVEELLDLGEANDFVEFTADFGAAHAEDRPVQINVLAPCQFRMEAGSDLEQAGDPAIDRNPACAGLGDARQDFQ